MISISKPTSLKKKAFNNLTDYIYENIKYLLLHDIYVLIKNMKC